MTKHWGNGAADVLYTDDVARMINSTPEAVRMKARRGAIPAPFRIGRHLAWRRSDFEHWLEKRAAAVPDLGAGR